MELKLNVLLAKTDHLATVFKKMIEDYLRYFKASQGAFKGEKKTYSPKPGTQDIPSERGNKLVVTTVDEKLKWFEENSKDYIDALFSQEKTNASGAAKAQLVVDGVTFGEFTSMELLRLKSMLESGILKEMYENLPVRNDDEIWNQTKNDMYRNRNIYESDELSGTRKSIMKEHYILQDPNIGSMKDAKYTPQVGVKDTVIELGDYTYQKFSGEASHLERANILARRSRLLTAVIEALKIANEVDAVESQMTAEKLFNYLHRGK